MGDQDNDSSRGLSVPFDPDGGEARVGVPGEPGQSRNELRVVFYENGAKCAEGAFVGGRPHGASLTWYVGGERRQEAHFHHGLLHGPYRFWHRNGKLAASGHYVFDEKVGTWSRWSEDGELIEERSFPWSEG